MDPKIVTAGQVVEADIDATLPAGGAPTATEGALALDTQTEEEHVTREQRRSRRKREVRARTISVKRMTKRELELGRML